MPIHLPPGLRRLSDPEFTQVAYEVMQTIFAVHNEMGSLFDESVYQRAVVQRLQGSESEVRIEVCFETFRKIYYLDLLVSHGAVFELKAAQAVVARHRAQLLNYLLLAELPHGKLVNFRGEVVEHEFVNATLSHQDRLAFRVDATQYQAAHSGECKLKELLVAILHDWGTCLDTALYQEALIHFMGGPQQAVRPVEIFVGGEKIGQQKLNLLSPETSVCISTLNDGNSRYEEQLRRFLQHTPLKAIQWVNIGRKLVTFKTITI